MYLPHPLWSLAAAAAVLDAPGNVPNHFEGLGGYVYHNSYATVSGLGPTACGAALPLLKVPFSPRSAPPAWPVGVEARSRVISPRSRHARAQLTVH